MKKLMLLGGSSQQIIAIETAKRLGYYTVLCDYLTDNPGQKYADKFYLKSTTDKEEILEVAKEEKIDGIIAYASDPAAPTAAFVAEKLGLPTNPYKSVDILANKDKFREFLRTNNFHTPKAKSFYDLESAINEIGFFKFPIIIKPVDSSGSKGVSKINNVDELKMKFDDAISYSKKKKVIIEEYVKMKGYQIAGDGFSIDGKLCFRCFGNDHFDKSGINPYVPISASFPYNMPEHIHKKIHNEIQRLFNLLNLKTGAYNFDIRIDHEENVYIMEIGPRNGGNFIPQVIKYATNIDMVELSILAAMGEEIKNIEQCSLNGYWSYYAIHSNKSGILKDIIIDPVVKIENIIEKHLNYKFGDIIPEFKGANGNLGILIMKFKSLNQMLNMMDNSNEWINIVVN